MTDFTISLAGVPIRVSALYESTRAFCRDYLSDGEGAFSVSVTQADLDAERLKSAQEDEREGLAVRRFSDRYLETLAVYRKICAALLERDILLFHGSAVSFEGQCYLFTAPSGTGKTTHSRLWLREIPGAGILNGDKPLLRFEKERVVVCGTPWQGKEGLGTNAMLPLAAICLLERSGENTITPVSFHDAMPALLSQSNRPSEAAALLHTLELVGRLGTLTKLYRLGCNMEPEAAHVSFKAMVGRDVP